MGLLAANRTRQAEPAVDKSALSSAEMAEISRLLHDQAGIVLTDKKRALVESRLEQRLRVLSLQSYQDYLAYLRADRNGDELVHLIDVISTNITKFFREPEHFALVDELVGTWRAEGADRLRFWSAGCSTGEEPYSLAMTLAPHAADGGLDLKILATDISTRVLTRAQAGIFAEDRLETVPAQLRRRYFVPAEGPDGGFAVTPALRDLVMFRRLNFTQIPYPIRGVFDVIMCRNAMIYFDRELRSRMVAEFARLLRPGGYLMVGHAETLIGIEDRFRTVKPSVYQCRNAGS